MGDPLREPAEPDQLAMSAREPFVLRRLIVGTVGLACLTPYFAWRDASSQLDGLLSLSLVAPLAVAFVVSRYGRLDWGYAVAACGSAGFVACLFAAIGPVAWPAALWLMAEPLNAVASGSKRGARSATLVSLTALALMLSAGLSGAAPAAPPSAGALAAAFLIGSALVEIASRIGVAGRARRDDGIEAERGFGSVDALEAIGDVVTWHDTRGDVLDAIGAARELTGRSTAALLGDGLFRMVHVSDRPAYLKALSDVANGGEPATTELRVHVGQPGTSEARLAWIEMRAQRRHGHGSQAASVIAHLRDASASRSRTEELERSRLDAQRADEMKGRFLATVSHELRTPLNAIIGFSELLGADHPYAITAERRKEYATIIRDSGAHLLEVVNALLDVSKIESGNFAFAPEPFSMADLIDRCCDLMSLKAEEAQIRLERRLAAELPDVVGDRRACRQILINLLSNAIKFTPAGGGVSVVLAREQDRIVLAVSDDGIGIRSSDLPRLGDPFFQAGDLHRRSHEGTGLGLSVVRGLVGLHRGTMEVESGPGMGTTVTVKLPIRGSDQAEAARPAAVRTVARGMQRSAERKSA